MIVQAVPHGQLLLPELFHPLTIDMGLHGSSITGQRHFPEGLGHTMQKPGDGEHHRGLAHGVPTVQEKLSVLVTLNDRLCEPVESLFPVLGNVLAHEIQLAQNVLSILVPGFGGGGQVSDRLRYIFGHFFPCKAELPKPVIGVLIPLSKGPVIPLHCFSDSLLALKQLSKSVFGVVIPGLC